MAGFLLSIQDGAEGAFAKVFAQNFSIITKETIGQGLLPKIGKALGPDPCLRAVLHLENPTALLVRTSSCDW